MKQVDIIKQIGKKEIYHIVFSTYKRKPIFINDNLRDWMEKLIIKISLDKKIKIIIINILARHVHVCLEKQKDQLLPVIMQYIKGITTYEFFSKFPDFKIDLKRGRVWAKGYNETRIKNKKQLENTIIYIKDKQKFYD